MHISFAGKKIRLLALAVTIFMIIFVSANWRLYLDPTLDLTCGTILFVLSLLAGPVAGFLIIFKPSVDDKYKALANTALFFIMPVLTIQMVEVFNENYIWWFSVPTFRYTIEKQELIERLLNEYAVYATQIVAFMNL